MPEGKKPVKAEVKKRPKPLYRKGWPKTMAAALYFNRKRRRSRG